MIPIRSELVSNPPSGDVVAETLIRTTDSTLSEPGTKRGWKRTGKYVTVKMPLFLSFTPTLERVPPSGYAIPASDSGVVPLLRLHGLSVEKMQRDWIGRIERFTIDSIAKSERPFQGHRETRLKGSWRASRGTIPAGSFVVTPGLARGVLAVYLLEPESDDGLVDWNFFDAEIARNKTFPVVRMIDPVIEFSH